jgi:hypothetical protein
MLKRILLCNTLHSASTPLQFPRFFSVQSSHKRSIAKRHFAVVVVVLLGLVGVAVGQGQDEAPPSQCPLCKVGISVEITGSGIPTPDTSGLGLTPPNWPPLVGQGPVYGQGIGLRTFVGMMGDAGPANLTSQLPGGAGSIGGINWNGAMQGFGHLPIGHQFTDTQNRSVIGASGLAIGGGTGAALFAFGFPQIARLINQVSPQNAMQQGLYNWNGLRGQELMTAVEDIANTRFHDSVFGAQSGTRSPEIASARGIAQRYNTWRDVYVTFKVSATRPPAGVNPAAWEITQKAHADNALGKFLDAVQDFRDWGIRNEELPILPPE